jgi:hypothetical protein
MKTKLITIIMILAAGIFSCDDEETVQDPIYEFISFAGDESVNLGEETASADGYPLVVQLWAFEPYAQDITVTLDVTATNAEKDVDFTVSPSDQVIIKAGKLTSDTIWIKTINNGDANELERTFDVAINTVSLPDVNVGLGLTEPKNDDISFKIQDDECSGNPICVYNTDLTNNINWGGDDVPKPATGVTDRLNNTVTVTGDLIDYGPFSGATLTLTLTPDSPGAAAGTATFGEQETGSDSDGYAYKFVETSPGSYNADTGTISIEYDIYYWDGGWVYWYSVSNDFSLP